MFNQFSNMLSIWPRENAVNILDRVESHMVMVNGLIHTVAFTHLKGTQEDDFRYTTLFKPQ